MMNEPEVGGMRQEDYSEDWVMHCMQIMGITDNLVKSLGIATPRHPRIATYVYNKRSRYLLPVNSADKSIAMT